MDSRKYATAAAAIILKLKMKCCTIATARAYWFEVTEDEPALHTIEKKYRTKAQIITHLERLINFFNGWGRNLDAETAHAEALEMDDQRRNYRRECDFLGSNDFAARRRIVEAAHVEALEMDAERDLQAYDKWAAEEDDKEETDTQPLRALAQFMQAGANKETFNYYVSRHGSVRAFECWQEDVRRLHAEHERAMSMRETFQTFAGRRG